MDSLVETISRHVATYFSKDVAQALDEQKIYYIRRISITGKSEFTHGFDWVDVKDADVRKDAELIVFANDKERPVNTEIVSGFDQCNVPVLNFSKFPRRQNCSYLRR